MLRRRRYARDRDRLTRLTLLILQRGQPPVAPPLATYATGARLYLLRSGLCRSIPAQCLIPLDRTGKQVQSMAPGSRPAELMDEQADDTQGRPGLADRLALSGALATPRSQLINLSKPFGTADPILTHRRRSKTDPANAGGSVPSSVNNSFTVSPQYRSGSVGHAVMQWAGLELGSDG